MRISDWSSDVCSSDLGPASGRKRTLWDGSLPFRGEIRRLGSLLPSRSREGPDYVPLSQPSPLKGRGLNGSSPPQSRQHRIILSNIQRWRSEEHTSELQSLMRTSYAVFCLKKKIN